MVKGAFETDLAEQPATLALLLAGGQSPDLLTPDAPPGLTEVTLTR